MGKFEDQLRESLDKATERARNDVTDWGEDPAPPVSPLEVERTVAMERISHHSKVLRALSESADQELGTAVKADLSRAFQSRPTKLASVVSGEPIVVTNPLGELSAVVVAHRRALEQIAEALGADIAADLEAADLPPADSTGAQLLAKSSVALDAHEDALLTIARRIDQLDS